MSTAVATSTETSPRRRWPVAVLLWLLLGPAAGLATLAVVLWGRWGRGTRARATAVAALLVVVTAAGWLVAGVPDAFEIGVFVSLGGRDWVDVVARAAAGTFAGALLLPDRAAAPAPPTQEAAGPGQRLGEVDRLRALAIVTVVLIHSLPFRAALTSPIDHWLGDVTRFSVATLVFLSGWLLPRAPVGLSWLRRRLARVLAPYLLASVVMLALSRVSPVLEARPPLRSLLTASAVGPYYYVAVLVVLTLLTPPIMRLSTGMRRRLLGAAAIAAIGIEVADLSLVAHNYQPATWLVYYLAGFEFRDRRDELAAASDRTVATVVLATAGVIGLLGFVPVGTPTRFVLIVLGMWGVLASLLLGALRLDTAPSPTTRELSRQSYLVYLYHPPLVAAVAGVFGSSILSLRPLSATVTAVVLCLSIGLLARAAWPETTRRWLGA